jgi:molybdenum cofactor biosynthesis enzyme MoaA
VKIGRISITDRCNERCLYCMPEGYKGWAQRPDHLTAHEILRLVRVAAGLGFRKFRLTGGDVASVLAGIRAAVAADFERVKLNAVLLRHAIAQKPQAHAFRDSYTPCRPMVAVGG